MYYFDAEYNPVSRILSSIFCLKKNTENQQSEVHYIYVGNGTRYSVKRVAYPLIVSKYVVKGMVINVIRFAVNGNWNLFVNQLEIKGDWHRET